MPYLAQVVPPEALVLCINRECQKIPHLREVSFLIGCLGCVSREGGGAFSSAQAAAPTHYTAGAVSRRRE